MEYKLKGGMPGMPQVPAALPQILMIAGGALAFLGLFVIYNPDLLRYMVGGVFLLIGALLALIGYRARRLVG
jgi:hypothetical protein